MEDRLAFALFLTQSIEGLDQSINDFIAEETRDHLWDTDRLHVVKGKGTQPAYHGELAFGESIEDEWFACHVLNELTRHFSSLLCRVSDNDGDFLLIESADLLPNWLQPETSEHRVWLYQGKVHLLLEEEGPRSAAEAIATVLDERKVTFAPEAIQQRLQSRFTKSHALFF